MSVKLYTPITIIKGESQSSGFDPVIVEFAFDLS